MKEKRIAVFISGRGSNFKAILSETLRGTVKGKIIAVVSDNPEAKGLEYARDHEIETTVFIKMKDEPHSGYFNRIMEFLEKRCIDTIILAGFMKVLSSNIIQRYRNRILNIHPALLPSFPGEEAQKQALEYGVKYSGCTVHFVDEGVDTGPIIIQEAVPVLDGDDVQTLSDRILEKEHSIFPKAVKLFCEERLELKGRRVVLKDTQ